MIILLLCVNYLLEVNTKHTKKCVCLTNNNPVAVHQTHKRRVDNHFRERDHHTSSIRLLNNTPICIHYNLVKLRYVKISRGDDTNIRVLYKRGM